MAESDATKAMADDIKREEKLKRRILKVLRDLPDDEARWRVIGSAAIVLGHADWPEDLRVLILNDTIRGRIAAVVRYADCHRVGARRMARIDAGLEPPIGDDRHHVALIPQGFRCAFSIEQQPDLGWCRHVSISVDTPGKWPHPVSVIELLPLFGFSDRVMRALRALTVAAARDAPLLGEKVRAAIWREDTAEAINVLEPMEGAA
jgi:hypothetical protein